MRFQPSVLTHQTPTFVILIAQAVSAEMTQENDVFLSPVRMFDIDPLKRLLIGRSAKWRVDEPIV